MKKNIADYINSYMRKENGFIKLWPQYALYKDLTLDYALEETIDIEDNFVQLGFNGTFFNKEKGEKFPHVELYQIPIYDNTSDSKVQLFISPYAIDSAVYAILQKQ